VDGSLIQPVSKIETYLADEWNATQVFRPSIVHETPKIIGFHAVGGEFSGFLNGFIMDMNNGASYTKYQEWKCASNVPNNDWYTYDYDDSLWESSKSYGMNYQNNSYQIFEHERMGIHLDAEWLWTTPNSKTNVFCRKKNNHVQAIEPVSTMVLPTTVTLATTSAPEKQVVHETTTATHAATATTTTTSVPEKQVVHETTTATHAATTTTKVTATSVPEKQVVHETTTATHAATTTTKVTTAATSVPEKQVVHPTTTATHAATATTKVTATSVPEKQVVHETTTATHAATTKVTATSVPEKQVVHETTTRHAVAATTKVTATSVSETQVVHPTTTRHAVAATTTTTTTTSVPETQVVHPTTTRHAVAATTKVTATSIPEKQVVHETTTATHAATATTKVTATSVPEKQVVHETTTAMHAATATATSIPEKHVVHIPARPENPVVHTTPVQNIIYNIKIIIRHAQHSKKKMDRHILRILHHLDVASDKYKIVKRMHAHFRSHYKTIIEYYKSRLERLARRWDEWDEEEKKINSKKLSKLINGMKIFNRYIKNIQYKLHFLKNIETKYRILHIFYAMKKQYHSDMIKIIRLYNPFDNDTACI
jgi:hypothetical protein